MPKLLPVLAFGLSFDEPDFFEALEGIQQGLDDFEQGRFCLSVKLCGGKQPRTPTEQLCSVRTNALLCLGTPLLGDVVRFHDFADFSPCEHGTGTATLLLLH
jgi:hypothetical protein